MLENGTEMRKRYRREILVTGKDDATGPWADKLERQNCKYFHPDTAGWAAQDAGHSGVTLDAERSAHDDSEHP